MTELEGGALFGCHLLASNKDQVEAKHGVEFLLLWRENKVSTSWMVPPRATSPLPSRWPPPCPETAAGIERPPPRPPSHRWPWLHVVCSFHLCVQSRWAAVSRGAPRPALNPRLGRTQSRRWQGQAHCGCPGP